MGAIGTGTVTGVVIGTLDQAMARGWGDKDSGVQVLIEREKAGVTIPPIDKAVLQAITSSD